MDEVRYMANEKVTLRFEEFDNDSDNTIISSGPISVYAYADDVTALNALPLSPNFPQLVDGVSPSTVVYVRNVTNESDPLSSRSRGAYFKYNYSTDSWGEIALGTHSHENKEFLDRLGDFDLTASNMGKGMLVLEVDSPDNGITFDYDVRFEEIPESLPLVPSGNDTNPLFLGIKNSGKVLTNVAATLTQSSRQVQLPFNEGKLLLPGQKIVKVSGTGEFGDYAEIESVDYNTDIVTLNTPHVLSGNVVFNIDLRREVDWSDRLVAPQTFIVKYKQLGDSASSISFEDINYNSSTDEVLVLDDTNFVTERNISYNSLTKVLTVTLTAGGTFSGNSKITLIVLKNGASAILDEIAADYLTKEEAVNLLTGGSINLRGYATQQDIRGKANRYHSHSQYARYDHDHDYRYANFNHTHSEYLTRSAALRLIEEVLYLEPDIVDTLKDISDIVEQYVSNRDLYQWSGTEWVMITDIYSTEPVSPDDGDIWKDGNQYRKYINNTWTVMTVNLTQPTNPTTGDYYTVSPLDILLSSLPSKADLANVQSSIDTINAKLLNMFDNNASTNVDLRDRMKSFLTEFEFNGSQVRVIDARDLVKKDLQEVLDDLRYDLDNDLANVNTTDVLIDTDITVNLGANGSIGSYNTDDVIPSNRTLTQVITELVQRRVYPVYTTPQYTVNFTGDTYTSPQSTVEITVVPTFIQNDAGPLTLYRITRSDQEVPLLDLSNLSATDTFNISVGLTPVTITVRIEYAEGVVKLDNFGDASPNGRITSNHEERTFTIYPVNPILKGFSDEPFPSLMSGDRANFIKDNTQPYPAQNYNSFSHELIVPSGQKTIIFAVPHGNNTVEKVLYREQGDIDIIGPDMFTPSEIITIDSVEYDIYIYEMPVQTRSAMTLVFIR
jgi:hypothetical protein